MQITSRDKIMCKMSFENKARQCELVSVMVLRGILSLFLIAT